ncbi:MULTISPECIES: NADPH-dependent FMN reductase [unclassified Vibrio]|uniref:NADPH-dependent FMN reductase n=1 Tax=unclassified Vibrio TaxID=2614977 RepID=UPI000B8E75AC|nr:MULTISPECIES: NAD(P)H-dependent oxidoreductase [unclassified Vibrio]EHI9239246.1 NAD(P)H-dependent oxidoreductase [Vibrio vulnificus]EIJ0985101.1 NAD(P)H-dependent oxidoreductase [Vibrio vulnificus]NAX17041.1 NADPH-dependent oxidoreductase [Vibrio sp. V22_P2S10T140]OXX43277.1 hypothetical protein B9J83_09535 [Vibrio sp. V07_P2A8T137]OXX57544.1 hypothetical protein B9J82_09930 [Vibrio sp. V10_P2A27P122]
MNTVIVSGSHREGSKSSAIAQYIKKSIGSNHETTILDLAEMNIPMWNEGFWDGTAQWDFWDDVAATLKNAEALVLIAPEWAGMVPPALKNFLLLCSGAEIGHKPCLIVSVSASKGGTNPVHELRATGYKNNHICFIPDHIIVRGIDDDKSPEDCLSVERLEHHTNMLFAYAECMKPLRENERVMNPKFKFGES